jgi:paraquat-inducible protein B
MGHLNQEVAPEAAAALSSTREAMKSLGSTLSEASPLQSDLRDTLRQLSRSARTLADLSDYLEQHPESLLRGKPKDSR